MNKLKFDFKIKLFILLLFFVIISSSNSLAVPFHFSCCFDGDESFEPCGGWDYVCDSGLGWDYGCSSSGIGFCSYVPECSSSMGDSCGNDVGACQSGTRSCSGSCVGDIGPTGEICDGINNDCDGSTDEGGVCSGGCGDPNSCTYSGNVNFYNDNCLYTDCNGECGGDAEEVECSQGSSACLGSNSVEFQDSEGSCCLEWEVDCNGICYGEGLLDCAGICDSNVGNDAVCGCTDATSSNFNPLATYDSGCVDLENLGFVNFTYNYNDASRDNEDYVYSLVTSPEGIITKFTRDIFGNLIEVERDVNGGGKTSDTQNNAASYTYDVLDNLKIVEDPRNKLATFNYNSLGQLISSSHPDSGDLSFEYDLNGNLIRSMIWDGNTNIGIIEDTYDELDRIVQSFSEYAGVSTSIIYYYDDNDGNSCMEGSETSYGFLCKIVTSTSNYNYDIINLFNYDSLGRLNRKTISFSGGNIDPVSLIYDYDLSGRLIDTYLETTNNDYITSFNYNKLSDLISVEYTGPSNSELWEYEYNDFGNVKSIKSNAQDLITYFNYDIQDKLVTITNEDSDLGQYIYGYGPSGEIINMSFSSSEGSKFAEYEYDDLSRLIGATGNYYSSPLEYAYDSSGNRNVFTKGAEEIVYMISSNNNQLIEYGLGDDNFEFFYNPTGALTQVDNNNEIYEKYQYDAFNKLIQYDKYQENNTITEFYAYDQTGNRIIKCTSQNILDIDLLKYYVYDGSNEPVYEIEYAYPEGCMAEFSLAELSPDLGLLDKFKLFFQKITSNAIKDIDKSKLSKSYEKEKSFDVSEKENLQKDNVEDSRFGKIYDKDIDKFKDRDIVKIKPVSNNVLPVQQPVQQEIFNYPSSISDYHLHESIREDPLISGGLKEVFYIKTGDKRLAKDEYQLQTINGCMDELAINYNYLANEVGSCEYFSLITGLLSVSGYDYDSVVPGDYIANAIMFESSGYEQVDNVQLKVDSAFHSVCENDLGYGAGVSGCCHEWTAGVPETCFSESTEQCDGGACIQNPKPFVTTEWIDVDDFENVQGNIWTAYTYLDVISNGIEESLEDWGDYESWSGQFFHIHTKISGSESSPVYIGSWEYPTAQEPSAFPTEFFILNEDSIGVIPLIPRPIKDKITKKDLRIGEDNEDLKKDMDKLTGKVIFSSRKDYPRSNFLRSIIDLFY